MRNMPHFNCYKLVARKKEEELEAYITRIAKRSTFLCRLPRKEGKSGKQKVSLFQTVIVAVTVLLKIVYYIVVLSFFFPWKKTGPCLAS